MTPKEKAQNLFKIFFNITGHFKEGKECALRAVDEMIGELACARTKDDNLTEEEIEILDINIDKRQDFLIEVEKEIEKL
jgi:hypothetical protein